MEFVQKFFGLHWLGFGVFGISAVADDAAFDVIAEELDTKGVEGGADGGDLVQDVDAVALVFDHALDAADLAGDAFDAGVEVLGRHGVKIPCGGILASWGVFLVVSLLRKKRGGLESAPPWRRFTGRAWLVSSPFLARRFPRELLSWNKTRLSHRLKN